MWKALFLRIVLHIKDGGFVSINPSSVGFSELMLSVSLAVFLHSCVHTWAVSYSDRIWFHGALLEGKKLITMWLKQEKWGGAGASTQCMVSTCRLVESCAQRPLNCHSAVGRWLFSRTVQSSSCLQGASKSSVFSFHCSPNSQMQLIKMHHL